MLISGANLHQQSLNKKLELHNLINYTKCSLEDMPDTRYAHTSVGGVICGGGGTAERTSCIDMSGGSWSSTKFQSIRSRIAAVSWNLNPGASFMILGGTGSSRTTDIVYTNGTVEPGFDLQYDSQYVVNFQIII